MERVTDAWLLEAEGDSITKARNADMGGGNLHRFRRLAFAQAVARECIEVIMCFNDRDEGVRNIRARFGLEDE